MKMSQTVSYAIQATMQLALSKSRDPVPCSQLAADGKMPERFLLQVLRKMVDHDILHSSLGVSGGYKLKRKPEAISLLQVIEAVDGPVTADLLTAGLPRSAKTQMKKVMQKVEDRLRRDLASFKISHLLPKQSNGARR
jgi:Rrf2 family transcriptional regulator, cysteine metabolism repressor